MKLIKGNICSIIREMAIDWDAILLEIQERKANAVARLRAFFEQARSECGTRTRPMSDEELSGLQSSLLNSLRKFTKRRLGK
jgi:hypothetical protein